MKAGRTLLVVAAMTFAATARPSAARAQSPQIFDVDPIADGGSAAAMIGAGFLLDANKRLWTGVSPCHGERRRPTAAERAAYDNNLLGPTSGLCDPLEVPRFDRWATEQGWRGAATWSDGLLLASVLSPLAFSGIDTAAAGGGGARVGDDAAITFQALGATYLATVVLKVAVGRPRPYTYNPRFDVQTRFKGDARMSFPSGHASLSFAGASILAVMLAERFGDDPAAITGMGLGYATATAVGAFRVLAGKHFLADVLAGAVLGTTLGLTIPLLQTKTSASGSASTGLPLAPARVVGIGGVF